MEFLGDTVLQLITSEYLYKHFPEHHEGHLSLLRSSIVNNRTQAVVCDDVGMPEFAAVANPGRKNVELKVSRKRKEYCRALMQGSVSVRVPAPTPSTCMYARKYKWFYFIAFR